MKNLINIIAIFLLIILVVLAVLYFIKGVFYSLGGIVLILFIIALVYSTKYKNKK